MMEESAYRIGRGRCRYAQADTRMDTRRPILEDRKLYRDVRVMASVEVAHSYVADACGPSTEEESNSNETAEDSCCRRVRRYRVLKGLSGYRSGKGGTAKGRAFAATGVLYQVSLTSGNH